MEDAAARTGGLRGRGKRQCQREITKFSRPIRGTTINKWSVGADEHDVSQLVSGRLVYAKSKSQR